MEPDRLRRKGFVEQLSVKSGLCQKVRKRKKRSIITRMEEGWTWSRGSGVNDSKTVEDTASLWWSSANMQSNIADFCQVLYMNDYTRNELVTFVKFFLLTISFPCITSFSPEIFFHPFTCKHSTPYTRTEPSSINLFPGSSSNSPCNHMSFSCPVSSSHNTPCNAVNFSIIKSSTLSANVIIIFILKKVKQHIVRRMKHLTDLAQSHDGVWWNCSSWCHVVDVAGACLTDSVWRGHLGVWGRSVVRHATQHAKA